MQISPSRTSLLLLAAILGLAGCATTSPTTSAALVQQASQAMASGSNEKAIVLLNEATKASPTDGEAWAKLAQAYFDNKDYPKAITAASEALARQPNNQEARGVQFVSSMRLAMSTLADIRKSNSQLAGNNRAEAEQVVRSLRDTLGETVLLPSNGGAVSGGSKSADKGGSGSSASTPSGGKTGGKKNLTGTKVTTAVKPAEAANTVKTPPAAASKPPATVGSAGGAGKTGGTPFDILK